MHPRGAPMVFWGGAFVFMRDSIILNRRWAQDKMYILVGTLLGLNILLIT
jgi:hypothetical protein